MYCNESIDSTNKVIVVQFFGEIIQEDLIPKTKLSRLMALILKYKIIFDFSESQICFSISEAFYVISQHYDSLDPRLKLVPVAHISSERDKKFFEFVETTFINRGANIRLCKDEQDARDWFSSLDDQALEPTCFDGFKEALQKMSFYRGPDLHRTSPLVLHKKVALRNFPNLSYARRSRQLVNIVRFGQDKGGWFLGGHYSRQKKMN